MKKIIVVSFIFVLFISTVFGYTITIITLENKSIIYGVYIKDTLEINETFAEKIAISQDEIYKKLFSLDAQITNEKDETKKNYLIQKYNEESARIAIINNAFFDRKNTYHWTKEITPSVRNIRSIRIIESFSFTTDEELTIELSYFISRITDKAELEKAINDIALIKDSLAESQRKQDYENTITKLTAEKTELELKNIGVLTR